MSQDVSIEYIDSVLALKNDKSLRSYKSMLRKINMSASDTSIAKFKYIDSITKNNDSLQLYNNQLYTSTLMRYGKNQEALKINSKGLKISKENNWPYFLFETYQLRANIFENLTIPDSTIFYINKAETIINQNIETLGHYMTRMYIQRSLLEQTLGNAQKEDEYMEKVAEVALAYPERNLTYPLSTVVYHFKTKNNYVKHAYFSEILKEYKLKKNGTDIPKAHQSLSSMLKMDNTKEQIKELKQALNTNDSLKYVQYLIQTSNALGVKFIETGNYDESIYYLNKSLNYNKENKTPYSRLVSYQNLYFAHKEKKNYEEAIEALNNYIEVQNNIRSQETLDKISDIEIKYDTEKKEAELKLLKLESEKKKKKNQLYLILALAGICIGTLAGFFGYKNKLKNKKLASQKLLLETALSEKNTLLKEIHHRVKNSFQIVSSLLYLQSENVDDKEAKQAIKEAENRVRSMIFIHQKLYNKDELVGINVNEYINDLTTDIVESHLPNPQSLQTILNVEPLILDIETITPLGLILNELITNVIKHAYQDIDDKLLQVDLKKDKNQLVLQVIDNGKGLDKTPSKTSFGITLMKALSKKLKAQLNINKREHKQGTVATLLIRRFEILN